MERTGRCGADPPYLYFFSNAANSSRRPGPAPARPATPRERLRPTSSTTIAACVRREGREREGSDGVDAQRWGASQAPAVQTNSSSSPSLTAERFRGRLESQGECMGRISNVSGPRTPRVGRRAPVWLAEVAFATPHAPWSASAATPQLHQSNYLCHRLLHDARLLR